MMRHFKVKDTKKCWMNSVQFDQWVEEYDTFDLDDTSVDFPNVSTVYVSSHTRALRTADFIDSKYQISDFVREVDAKAFTQTSLLLPKWLWLFISRIQWYFNISKGENRVDTIRRIEYFFQTCDLQQNIMIITHGFVMKIIIKVLKKHGFDGKNTFIPHNGKVYRFKKLAILE